MEIVTIYKYGANGCHAATCDLAQSPTQDGGMVFNYPENCTLVEPLPPEETCPQIQEAGNINSNWNYIEDHRGKTAYVKETKRPVIVTEVGELADDLTLLEPTPDSVWNYVIGDWVADLELTKESKLNELWAYRNDAMSFSVVLLADSGGQTWYGVGADAKNLADFNVITGADESEFTFTENLDGSGETAKGVFAKTEQMKTDTENIAKRKINSNNAYLRHKKAIENLAAVELINAYDFTAEIDGYTIHPDPFEINVDSWVDSITPEE